MSQEHAIKGQNNSNSELLSNIVCDRLVNVSERLLAGKNPISVEINGRPLTDFTEQSSLIAEVAKEENVVIKLSGLTIDKKRLNNRLGSVGRKYRISDMLDATHRTANPHPTSDMLHLKNVLDDESIAKLHIIENSIFPKERGFNGEYKVEVDDSGLHPISLSLELSAENKNVPLMSSYESVFSKGKIEMEQIAFEREIAEILESFNCDTSTGKQGYRFWRGFVVDNEDHFIRLQDEFSSKAEDFKKLGYRTVEVVKRNPSSDGKIECEIKAIRYVGSPTATSLIGKYSSPSSNLIGI